MRMLCTSACPRPLRPAARESSSFARSPSSLATFSSASSGRGRRARREGPARGRGPPRLPLRTRPGKAGFLARSRDYCLGRVDRRGGGPPRPSLLRPLVPSPPLPPRLSALVVVRQAFWLVPETIALGASIGVAALLGFLRLRARRSRLPLPAAFWLGTAAPLGLFWALHLAYPDVGFDNLNYHILHGERALRGLLAIPGDFYPHYFPSLNPAPDMLSA